MPSLPGYFKSIDLRSPLFLLLLTGLIQGLLFYFIVPPWWHYDEPGHFEYAWLAANRTSWPRKGEFDEAMRRQMAESMSRYEWYKIRNYKLDLSAEQEVWIGVPQVGGQPGYYFLASLPLRLLQKVDITIQYEAARFISLLLYLLIILVVWHTLAEIMPQGHPLQWMVTAFLVLLPAFVDEMVSVNDDVSAVLACSLFLWASLRLIKRGPSAGRLLFLGLALALCYFCKTTTWFVFLLAPLVVLFALLHGRFTAVIWGVSGLGVLVGAFLLLEGGMPVAWHQTQVQVPSLQLQTADAPIGDDVFQMDFPSAQEPGETLQILPPSLVQSLRGKTVTFGAWLWADHTAQSRMPFVSFETQNGMSVNTLQTILNLNTKPSFYRAVFTVPIDANFATVIAQYDYNVSGNSKTFMDGLVLAEGEYGESPPHFRDGNGTRGDWGGQSFDNLIRNGSAEQGSLRLQPWAGEKTGRLLTNYRIDVPLILSTLQDWQGSSWYYRGIFAALNRTFWVSLAGDKVHPPGNRINDFLAWLAILGIAGTVRFMWLKRRGLPWDIIYILGVTLIIPWALAAIRGVSSLLSPYPFLSWARYAYPAILPTALVICTGWLEWLNLLQEKLRFTDAMTNAIFLGGMLGLSVVAMLNAVQFFHQRAWTDWGTIALLIVFQYLAFQFIIKGWSRLRPSS